MAANEFQSAHPYALVVSHPVETCDVCASLVISTVLSLHSLNVWTWAHHETLSQASF